MTAKFWALQTLMMKLFTKILINVNLKLLTVLAKRSNLHPWLGPE